MSKSISEPLTPMENAQIDRPSQSRADAHPTDRIIRSNGSAGHKWQIHLRPKHGEPLWSLQRDGMDPLILPQSEVLKRIAKKA